jgi:peptidoglycan lytic transglycosylase G
MRGRRGNRTDGTRRPSRDAGPPRRSRVKTLLIFLGVFLWIPVMMGLVLYYLWSAVPYRGYPGPRLLVEIPRRPAREVLQILEDRGIIRPSPFSRIYLEATGRAGHLKAGEYLFEGPMTTPRVLEKLFRGETYYHKVTIPEGLRSAEIFSTFQREGFGSDEEFHDAFRDVSLIASLDPEATDLEGYLFPDTYHLSRGATAREVVTEMVRHHLELWTPEWLRQARSQGLTPRQVVTLASLIEKETAREDERPLVSSVFHNRLEKGMRLQCDPTIIYALAMRGRYRGVITRKDLELDSRYNTYAYSGLPPGPIANPGKESLRAALYPERTAFLYFVSMNNGRHTFSTNLEDHSRAVRQYQR